MSKQTRSKIPEGVCLVRNGDKILIADKEKATEYIQALESKNKELEAELNNNKWISVDDRLPEDNAVVLVFSESGLDSDYYYADRWQRNEITFWKPITPPKGE